MTTDNEDTRRRLLLHTGVDLTLSLSLARMVGASRPCWQRDSDSEVCMLCNSAFTFVRRRHHCRRCGRLVCAVCTAPATSLNGERFPHVCDLCRELVDAVDNRSADTLASTRVARTYLLTRARGLTPRSLWSAAATALQDEGIDPAALGPPGGTEGPPTDPVLLGEALRGLRNACTTDAFRRVLRGTAGGSVILEIAAGAAAIGAGPAATGAKMPPALRATAGSEHASLVVRHALSLCINYSASHDLAPAIDLVDRGLFVITLDGLRRHEPVISEFQAWLIRNLSRDTRCGTLLPSRELAAPGTRDALFLLLSAPVPSIEFAAAAVANFVAQDPETLVSWFADGRPAGALALAVAQLLDHPVPAAAAVGARLARFVAAAEPARAADERFDLVRRLVELAASATTVAARDAAVSALAAVLNRCHYMLTNSKREAAPPTATAATSTPAHSPAATAAAAAASARAPGTPSLDSDAPSEPPSHEGDDDISAGQIARTMPDPAAPSPLLPPEPATTTTMEALAAEMGSPAGSEGETVAVVVGRPLAPPPLLPAGEEDVGARPAPTPSTAAYEALCHSAVVALTPEILGSILRHGQAGGFVSAELVCQLVAELLRFTQSAEVVLSSHRAVRALLSTSMTASPAAKRGAREVMRRFRSGWKKIRPDEPCPFSKN